MFLLEEKESACRVRFKQIKSLLFNWSKKGKFSFSTKPSDWEKQGEKLLDTDEGYKLVPYYYAYAISYIVEKKGGFVLSYCKYKWHWAQGLVALILEVEWDTETFHQVLSAFGKKVADEIETRLSYSINLYCRKDFDNGLALMKLIPEKEVDCLSGLMMNDFHRACEVLQPNKDKEKYAQAFVRTENLDGNVVCVAYEIAVSFKAFTGSTALAFFLKAYPSLDDERRKECEDRIKGMLEMKSSSLLVVLCNWLFRQDAISPFIEDCVLLSLTHLEHPKEDIGWLDRVLGYKLVNIGLFEKMAELISETYEPELVMTMESCLHRLIKDDVPFGKMVLKFILHPKSKFRVVGREIWDEYHLEKTGFDPLSLSEEEQIVFVVFMLQDLGNPEIRLPKVLPLFLSTSEKVKQALIVQMIPYIDNYMGHVTEAMDQLGLDTNETRMLKQYVERRAEAIQKRRELKELSPKYAQYRYYQEACRVEKEAKSQYIKEIEEKGSFQWMNMCRKEVLARGGGWRMENGKTNQLAKIQVSVPSRMMVQSMTPLEQDKWINLVYKDWDVTERDN